MLGTYFKTDSIFTQSGNLVGSKASGLMAKKDILERCQADRYAKGGAQA
jgi:hypothetical protein